MYSLRTWNRSAFALAAFALLAFATSPAWAKGGGHGGGGEHHGGGGHHGGEHHANHHPYHPSKHHEEHHAADHHDDHHGDHHEHFAHHNHHHSSWHHGDWGPGFWGGAALGYGAGYAWAPWGWDGGGDTYVDNSTNVTPAYNDNGDADDASNNGDDSNNNQSAPNTADNENNGFPTDDWPELGVTTYAGQYGGSEGQVIVRIVPNSAAAKAGFVPGDVILSLNGQPTPSADALDEVLDTANGQFTAQVWDARTGRTSTIAGALDANEPAEGESNATAAVSQQ